MESMRYPSILNSTKIDKHNFYTNPYRQTQEISVTDCADGSSVELGPDKRNCKGAFF